MPWGSPLHFFYLAVSLLIFVGAVRLGRRYAGNPTADLRLRTFLFWSILGLEIFWSAFRHFVLKVPLRHNLPLHLSDLAFFLALITLAQPRERLIDLLYFTALFGLTLALVFPEITETGAIVPVAIARYYLSHALIVGAALYLTFGSDYYPRFAAVLRAWIMVVVYAACLVPVNLWLGTNYAFVSAPPRAAPEVFHHLPLGVYLLGYVAVLFLPVPLLALFARAVEPDSTRR